MDSSGTHHDNPTAVKLRAALERELHADETVQWHGWQLGRIEPKAFWVYVFAVPWTAFSLMWTVLASTAVGAPGFGLAGIAFPLFGLPFIAIGAWMLSRPFVPLWERGRVLFVATDRRVLKLAAGRELTITAAPSDRIGLIRRSEKPDGSGTLNLAIRIGRDSDGDRQVENFDIGPVSDIIGAQAAIDRIAAGAELPGGAGALSS